MAELIFAEQTLTPFSYFETFGAYTFTDSTPDFILTADEVYTVIWDNTPYVRTAYAFTAADGAVCVAVGNELVKGGSNTGEPFIAAYDSTNNYIQYISTETDTSHTFALYEGDITESEGYLLDNLGMSFAASDDFGGLHAWMNDAAAYNDFRLVDGVTYTVIWEGEYHVGVAQSLTVGYRSGVALGNVSFVGAGEDTDEPFLCIFLTRYDDGTTVQDLNAFAFTTSSTDGSHTVSVYAGVLEPVVAPEQVNLVLYDRNGDPVTYTGIKTVTFNTDVEDTTATFTLGTAPDETTVALNLAEGAQTVQNTETGLLKKVVIQKPGGLAAENIKKGVEIAGITGELIGEGVSKTVDLNELDLSGGSDSVVPDPETLLSEVVITKPDSLTAENIKKGVEIAGVVGDVEVPELLTNMEIPLDFSTGDQTVVAPDGYAVQSAIIKQPDTLRPEHIAEGVDIAGVVGTLSAGGAESVPPSDINFYDYDGTIVAAWTLEELAAATELPANPTHEGLISQGWNWTLDDLKTTNRAMNVGQMYITDDGKTRLYIRITVEGMVVPLYISQAVANGVTIDWGDGSATQTLAGTGNVNTTHTYASIGNYVITLDPADGCTLGFGNSNSSYCLLGITGNDRKAYLAILEKVEIGAGVTELADYAFQTISHIKSITIPASITTMGRTMFTNVRQLKCVIFPTALTRIGDYFMSGTGPAYVSLPKSLTALGLRPFQSCSALESLTIPDGVTRLSEYFIQNGMSLRRLDIPDGVTTLGTACLYYAYCLVKLTIPASVTSIAESAFGYCYGMKEYHFKRTTPPTLAKSNAFQSIPTDCIIYVPKGCLSAYKSATNWSTYASYMREETE